MPHRADEHPDQTPGAETSADHSDDDLIAERLRWTPKQRLDYLLDMLEFEERARRARKLS